MAAAAVVVGARSKGSSSAAGGRLGNSAPSGRMSAFDSLHRRMTRERSSGLGSTTVTGSIAMLASSNARPPRPPATSMTPPPDRSTSMLYVDTRKRRSTPERSSFCSLFRVAYLERGGARSARRWAPNASSSAIALSKSARAAPVRRMVFTFARQLIKASSASMRSASICGWSSSAALAGAGRATGLKRQPSP